MRKKFKNFLLMGLCLLGLTACASVQASEQGQQTSETQQTASLLDEPMDNLTGAEFQKVAEGTTMELLLRPSDATIRWQSKVDGTYQDTKIFDGASDNMKSDLVVYYYNGASSNIYSTIANMNSYKMSVETGKVYYQLMDNGVRVIYDVGNDEITYKNFPKYITKERMEEFVLQYLDEAQKRIINNKYTLTKSGIYSRGADKDHVYKKLAAEELYNLFYEVGKYTNEELIADNEEFEIESDEYPSNLVVVVPMEFTLDGDDLKVNIPTDKIEVSDEMKQVSYLEILPYFLSTQETEGYMFVPDGSGALINLDNTRLNENQFSARFYGGDKLVNNTTYDESKINMTMPVFGLKESNRAILGIIEEGAEAATLSAYINKSFQNEPVSRMGLSFNIRERQRTKSSSRAASSDYFIDKTTDDYYNKNFTVRYHYLTGEEANYVGMADYYAKYLEEKGILTKQEDDENAPFYLELLGAVDKQKYVVGIPYDGTEPLTTFKQAQDILTSLTSSGVKNIKLIYNGIINEGINQRSAEKVSLVSELGSKSAWKSLLSYADSIGAEVFPNVKLQTAYTTKGLSTEEVAYTLNNEKAILYEFEPVLRTIIKKDTYLKYIINPGYFVPYINKFNKSYASLGVNNLASDDLMTFLPDTYRKNKQVSQTSAKEYMISGLEILEQNKTLMLSNPIDLAYSYTDYISDLPIKSSGLRILDNTVPFMQLVLDGYMTYSTTNINKDSLNITEEILHAVEGKSALKFSFLAAEAESLRNTMQNGRFAAQFSIWQDEIGKYYEQYNSFYQKVKNASITDHQILDNAGLTRIVTYSNGVKVYLNYGDEEAAISGVKVAAQSFVVE